MNECGSGVLSVCGAWIGWETPTPFATLQLACCLRQPDEENLTGRGNVRVTGAAGLGSCCAGQGRSRPPRIFPALHA